MDNIIIRPAGLGDAPGIAKVHVKTWQSAYSGILPDDFLDGLSVEKRTIKWEENLSDQSTGNKTFVAEYDGEIIGFGGSGPCRDEDMLKTGELLAIYMDQNYMGRGAGSELHRVCLDYLRQLGYDKATLWVFTSNQSARRWYEARGWRVEGKTKTDQRDTFEAPEMRYIIDL